MSMLNPSARLTMPGQIHKAYKVMLKLINPKFVKADAKIPLKILQNAKGVAFITVVKAGFVWSGTLGSGIVVARLPNGSWSGPSSIGVGGMGWGALIGASVTDSVIILNNDLAVAAFSGHGQIKLGGNLSIAAGPVGREADGSAHVGDGGVAACYSYSHSRGLFAGVSLQGAIMVTRDSDNTRFYGHAVKATEILRGLVEPPEFEDLKRLYDCLNVVRSARAATESSASMGYQDPTTTFRDAQNISFAAPQQAKQLGGPGINSQAMPSWMAREIDNDDDDDKGAQAATQRFGGWQQPSESEDAFAGAFSASTSSSAGNSSAAAQQGGALPPGWAEVVNPDGGPPYYWHEAKGLTTWDRPAPQVRQPAPLPPPMPSAVPNALPPGWMQVTDPTGAPYYWHEKLNKTQWERPLDTPPPSLPPRGSSVRTTSSSASFPPVVSARPASTRNSAPLDNPFA